MVFKFLQSLEDPEKPLIGPNCWFLRKTGQYLPENKFGKAVCVSVHIIATWFVFSQFIELYVIRSDLDLVLTNLKISMLSFICIFKSNTFVFWQKDWLDIMDYITKADKFERESRDEAKMAIVGAYTKYCRRVNIAYCVLVFTTVVNTIGNPFLIYISSGTYRENLRNGTEPFLHIFSSWMPFDKNHSSGIWMTVIWHILICFYGASVLAAYDTTAIMAMVFFGGKLDLLRIRCKEMLGSDGSGISDIEADRVIAQLHNMHIQLLKYSRMFNSKLSPVMFVYVAMCTMMLCASAYQLTSATSTGEKLLMAEYLIFGVAQLFIFCWHSNHVLVKNEQLHLGPYECNWWAANLRQRKSVLLLAGQMRISQIFTAGPFTNLTLPTFITILKGAYSYYTLLRK